MEFPLLMASWKFAPALAAGNSVILKPSEKSPLTAIRIAALAHEAGIPAGVFQVLPGDGEVGKLLSLHMDVCLAFTGSTAVGKRIMGYAAESNLKRVWLELGGKSPNIVLADCRTSPPPPAPPPAGFISIRAKCARPARACWCTTATTNLSPPSSRPRLRAGQPAGSGHPHGRDCG
ncbi:MAG: aldehyde dehydrogenase family protein [Rivihabitans pingtungensis]